MSVKDLPGRWAQWAPLYFDQLYKMKKNKHRDADCPSKYTLQSKEMQEALAEDQARQKTRSYIIDPSRDHCQRNLLLLKIVTRALPSSAVNDLSYNYILPLGMTTCCSSWQVNIAKKLCTAGLLNKRLARYYNRLMQRPLRVYRDTERFVCSCLVLKKETISE